MPAQPPQPGFLDLHGLASKALRAAAEAGMRRHSLHLGQNLPPAELRARDGRAPGEIAAALHVTTPTVGKIADRMAAVGLLTRRRDDQDNRLVRLWLTDAGRALKEPVEAERRQLEEQVTVDLTATERAHLMRAPARVHASASALLERAEPDPSR